MLHRVFWSIALASIASLTACSSKPIEDSAQTQQPTQPTTSDTAPAQSGVTVFVDPRTGEIREPTAAERAALEAQRKAAPTSATQTAKPPQEIKHADGTVEVIIDPSHDQPVKACTQPDGSVSVSHEDCESPNQVPHEQRK